MDLEQRNPLGSCRFCSHLTDVEREVSVNSPWHRNAQYGALVSIGALVPGWSLVCPVEHCFNLSRHYKRDEFWEFCTVASEAVAQRYGNVRIFEHGAQFSGSKTGCGTDHAHLHLVPLDFSLAREALRYNSSRNWTPCLARDIEELAQNQEYLFVADEPCERDTSGLLCLPSQAESQFFRRVIAERIGLRDLYDYKKYPMLDIAESSLVDLVADLSTAR